jgi:hypothetical protein
MRGKPAPFGTACVEIVGLLDDSVILLENMIQQLEEQ